MSLWDEVNQDATSVAPEAAAVSRRVGFLDAFETSYNAQVRSSAMFGIEKAMYDLDAEQADMLRSAGVEDVPHLSDDAFGFFGKGAFSGDYLDAARFYQDGGDPAVADRLKAYDAKVDEYRKKFPQLELRTSQDMWGEVRETARSYENRASNERTTLGGTIGGFIGGAVGGLNVESDPFNFATIPVGGVGKNIVGRIAGEGAAQGFVEGINQITGVQEQRRLLDLSTGFADGLSRVAGAAIGGAALQGTGEALGAGFRRFFRNAPNDPAPPPPVAPSRSTPTITDVVDGVVEAAPIERPARTSPQTYTDYLAEVSPWSNRAARARTVLDADNVRLQLEDWTGPNPAFTSPKTDTALTPPRNDFTTGQANIFDRAADTPNYDQIARQVDPDTFRVYDKLATENETYRRWLRELDAPKAERVDAQLAEINGRIDKLKDKAATSGAMKAKKYNTEIAALVAERDAVKTEVLSRDTPDMAKVREKLMRNDEKMRDMMPVISRAYARAQSKWTNTAADREAIRKMIAEGKQKLDAYEPASSALEHLPKSLYDKAPVLQQRYKVEDQITTNADAAEIASKIHAKNAKENETVLEAFRKEVEATVKKLDDAAETKKENIDPKTGMVKPKEGMVRYYHGTGYESAEGFTGKTFVSPHYEYARDYHGGPNNVLYVDIPKAEAIERGLWDEINEYPRNGSITDGASTLKRVQGENEILIPGHKDPINIERETVTLPNEDGRGERTITIKQLMEEQRDVEDDLKAVTSCSI